MKYFLLRAGPIKKNALGLFQNTCFSLPSARCTSGFSADLRCENLVRLLEVKLTKVWSTPTAGPPWNFLTLKHIPTEPPAAPQWQHGFSSPSAGFYRGFCLELLLQHPVILCLPGCLSHLRGSSLPCDFSFLKYLRTVVSFKFVQLFSCCVCGTDDFQVPYILDWKLKSVQVLFFDSVCVRVYQEGCFPIVSNTVTLHI